MSLTVEVASAPRAQLSTLQEDEDFEVLGIELEELDDDVYGIAISNQSSHSYVILGTPHELQQFVARLMTLTRTIASFHEGEQP